MRTSAPLVLACVAGCTVFSGWDDLRGGKRTPTPTPTGEDGGPVATEPDAAVGTDATTPPSGKCTATTCSPLLCCRDFTSGASSCAQSCPMTAVELRCGSAQDCQGSAAGPVCCIATPGAKLIADCTSFCPTGELCDPAVGCASPKKCAPGNFGVDQCQ